MDGFRGSMLAALAVAALAAPSAQAAPATGGPGALSHFDLARKDCVGTARNTDSRVWYTVADGVLSDVYEPNVDTTNVETMQFIVTDGKTFTDLQSRDMTYTVDADPTGMVCTVTSKARNYTLKTTYSTDPARDTVLVKTDLEGKGNLKLYVRLDPTIGGHGGGGTDNAGADSATADRDALVAGDTTTETAAVNRDYARPTFLALQADKPFTQASAGFVGTPSDGLAQLDGARRLTEYDRVDKPGNVVLTAALHKRATLALGFGRTADQARRTADRSLETPYALSLGRYLLEWALYDARLERPSPKRAAGYYLGVNVVKASEDKEFPGAIAAGLASPWGQAVPAGNKQDGKAPYFGSYREVFSRDLYEASTALLVAGDVETVRDSARFLLERQQLPDGRMPRNSLLNGKVAPDTGGDQLDETAFPILMAYQSGLSGDKALYTDHIRKAADFLVARGPSFGNERWEEQGGYSPSTIAAEIAGLVAAGRIAATQHDDDRSKLYLATADHFQRSIKGWTVTTTGPYAPGHYFIRLSRNGDPDANITYNLGNGGPDADQKAVIDQGFLELTRLGALSPDDPDVKQSLPVVDRVIRKGDGIYRYGTDTPGTEDGYGDCHVPDPTDCTPEGKPWPGKGDNHGSGHLWPVLSGERAEQQLQTGDVQGAAKLYDAMSAFAWGVGLMPEQVWENPPLAASPFGSDPQTASIGFFTNEAAGSATPLTWAQAQHARLALSLDAGRPLEQPAAVRDRYKSPPAKGALTVTAPTDNSTTSNPTTHVTGTAAARARIVVAATNIDTGAPTVIAATTADNSGAFDVTVPTTFGTTTITTTATTASSTAYDQRRVASDVINGTTVFDTTDPAGDDHGPGTFQYPTSGDFKDGAFDLLRFQVIDGGDTVYLRTTLRDLTPTFGDPLGAQLLTIFARNPADSSTSTAPFVASRNYTVDPWTRGLEVRGFAAPRLVNASFASVGSPVVQASQVTRTITILVPKSAFGAPGPGWTWNVILHGQDGFGEDNARTFAPTPQSYQFGRCATDPSPDPRCSVPVNQLPKAMDVLGTSNLDRSQGPVVIHAVS